MMVVLVDMLVDMLVDTMSILSKIWIFSETPRSG